MNRSLHESHYGEWSGSVRRRDCINDVFHHPYYGEGIYADVIRRSDPDAVTMDNLQICGIHSRAYRDAESKAERLGYPLGQIGTVNAVLREMGFDGLFVGNRTLVIFSRSKYRVMKAD